MTSSPAVSKPIRPRVSPENSAERQHRTMVAMIRAAVSAGSASSSSTSSTVSITSFEASIQF